MSDLTDFLLARIAEDEEVARAAGAVRDPRWRTGTVPDEDGDVYDQVGVYAGDGDADQVIYDEGRPDLAESTHIARHDPARVLAECEAKRRIVKRHPTDHASCATYWDRETCAALLDLGAAYASHPDYREEWKP